jgi:hypothetical protein
MPWDNIVKFPSNASRARSQAAGDGGCSDNGIERGCPRSAPGSIIIHNRREWAPSHRTLGGFANDEVATRYWRVRLKIPRGGLERPADGDAGK